MHNESGAWDSFVIFFSNNWHNPRDNWHNNLLDCMESWNRWNHGIAGITRFFATLVGGVCGIGCGHTPPPPPSTLEGEVTLESLESLESVESVTQVTQVTQVTRVTQ